MLLLLLATINLQMEHEALVAYCRRVREVAEHIQEAQQYQVPSFMTLSDKTLNLRIWVDAQNTPIVIKHRKRTAVREFGDKWQTICVETL